MLKRIHSWMERVDQLHDEILACMPAQYRNPRPVEGELTASLHPNRDDPVACQWTACDRAVCDLWGELAFLEGAIVERTGVTVPFKAKPGAEGGGNDPDETAVDAQAAVDAPELGERRGVSD